MTGCVVERLNNSKKRIEIYQDWDGKCLSGDFIWATSEGKLLEYGHLEKQGSSKSVITWAQYCQTGSMYVKDAHLPIHGFYGLNKAVVGAYKRKFPKTWQKFVPPYTMNDLIHHKVKKVQRTKVKE